MGNVVEFKAERKINKNNNDITNADFNDELSELKEIIKDLDTRINEIETMMFIYQTRMDSLIKEKQEYERIVRDAEGCAGGWR